MNERQFQFEWSQAKAAINLHKHGVEFELACTIFNDPGLLTVADLEHSESEERWLSIGCAGNGAILFAVYFWSEVDPQQPRSVLSLPGMPRRMKSVSIERIYERPANRR